MAPYLSYNFKITFFIVLYIFVYNFLNMNMLDTMYMNISYT